MNPLGRAGLWGNGPVVAVPGIWQVCFCERRKGGRRTSGSQIQYGSQASSLLTTPHFRHTIIRLSQQLKTSVLNQPSQEVRRELALGERFLGLSRPGRSIGPPQKPQKSCQTAGRSGGRREGFTLKLADEACEDTNICLPVHLRVVGLRGSSVD